MAKLEEGLIYLRVAGTQVFLAGDPEVDTQKHGGRRRLVQEQLGANMMGPFVDLLMISFPSQRERGPTEWESWTQESWEDRLVRCERGDKVREDSGQQGGECWLCLP
jgi:hypothetical protein